MQIEIINPVDIQPEYTKFEMYKNLTGFAKGVLPLIIDCNEWCIDQFGLFRRYRLMPIDDPNIHYAYYINVGKHTGEINLCRQVKWLHYIVSTIIHENVHVWQRQYNIHPDWHDQFNQPYWNRPIEVQAREMTDELLPSCLDRMRMLGHKIP